MRACKIKCNDSGNEGNMKAHLFAIATDWTEDRNDPNTDLDGRYRSSDIINYSRVRRGLLWTLFSIKNVGSLWTSILTILFLNLSI